MCNYLLHFILYYLSIFLIREHHQLYNEASNIAGASLKIVTTLLVLVVSSVLLQWLTCSLYMYVRNVQTEREIFLTEKALKDIFIIVASTENCSTCPNHLLLTCLSYRNRASILYIKVKVFLLYFSKSFS